MRLVVRVEGRRGGIESVSVQCDSYLWFVLRLISPEGITPAKLCILRLFLVLVGSVFQKFGPVHNKLFDDTFVRHLKGRRWFDCLVSCSCRVWAYVK